MEVNGQKLLQPACSYPICEGMGSENQYTKSFKARKNILELMLAHHLRNVLPVTEMGNCELQSVAEEMNMNEPLRYEVEERGRDVDYSSPSIVHDSDNVFLWALCRRM